MKRLIAALVLSLITSVCTADEVVFEDRFDDGLSEAWQIVGLTKTDYRIREGGLEIRSQQAAWNREMPMIKVAIDGGLGVTTRATVEVEVLGEFENDGQFAGLFLFDEISPDFRATQMRLDRDLVFSPGRYTYRGVSASEEDFATYEITYPLASTRSGPLNIVVRNGNYATFQVGPAEAGMYKSGRYLNLFHSSIRQSNTRGFALTAAGAVLPSDVWVRFDNFRVVRAK